MRKKLHPLEGILMKSMVADATFLYMENIVYGECLNLLNYMNPAFRSLDAAHLDTG